MFEFLTLLTTTFAVGLGSGGPCQPEFFPTYPGAQVRQELFEGIELTVEQCDELADRTKKFLDEVLALQSEMETKTREERQAKLRSMILGHAISLEDTVTSEQLVRFQANLVAIRERLGETGGFSHLRN